MQYFQIDINIINRNCHEFSELDCIALPVSISSLICRFTAFHEKSLKCCNFRFRNLLSISIDAERLSSPFIGNDLQLHV